MTFEVSFKANLSSRLDLQEKKKIRQNIVEMKMDFLVFLELTGCIGDDCNEIVSNSCLVELNGIVLYSVSTQLI